jgi:hexosaminidase
VSGHPVIPAPVRYEAEPGRFALRSGTKIAYTAAEVAPIVARFCAQITRRTGLRLAPVAGHPGPDEGAIRIELATGDESGRLPAPLGVSPGGDTPPDERHSLTVGPGQVLLRAAAPAGVVRGLTTLIQLTATRSGGDGNVSLPGARILDAPRYAWRGLSLDLARRFLAPGEVRRVIDLLALYKLNVLHLHLTDDQGWRLPQGRPAGSREPDAPFYTAEDLRALVAYATDRLVTVVPEVDMPGHASALLRMHPELNSGRNELERESASGQPSRAVWLDPQLPATFPLVADVLAGVAEMFPGPYLHIGGDEPFGMPHDLYVAYVRRVRDLVRSIGKRPVGWQESARAGLRPDDIIQYWFSGIAFAPSLPPEILAQLDADLAASRRDVQAAAAASARVIVSPMNHCYLDVPYAEPSADPAQAARQARAGLRGVYLPLTVAESFDWEPAAALGAGRDPQHPPASQRPHAAQPQVAGVEAAIWAETIADFGDLSFLLLPRLPGVAHKAWSDPHVNATTWADHRDRLAWHGRLWAQDDLDYFRASTVDWR